MTINLALACIQAMQTTATATTNQTNTTSALTALDANIVDAFINEQTTGDIAIWIADINTNITNMKNYPTNPHYQEWTSQITADQTNIQAQQTVIQSKEQQADKPVQTAQTLTSGLGNDVTQLNGFMQSINQGQTYLSNICSGPV